MTDAAREPVTLDEMIGAVKRALALPRSPLTTSRDFAQEDADLWLGVCLRRAIETLQQHKRVVEAAEEWSAARKVVIDMASVAGTVISSEAITRLSKAENSLRSALETN